MKRLALAVALLLAGVAAAAAFIWRGPSWDIVAGAFTAVKWRWVVAAIGINLVSVLVRSVAWKTVIDSAMPAPRPGYRSVFSAFSIGLLANAALPGRVGEVARVAVLARRVPDPPRDAWPRLAGTVFAHRVFDLLAVALLVLYVLAATTIPPWAVTILIVVVAVGVGLLGIGVASARRHHLSVPDGVGRLQRFVTMARHGLGILRSPLASTLAVVLQCLGWMLQLFAVWVAMRAFQLEEPLAAAGLVLVLMNVAGILPLWPGNVGLVQAAVALPLGAYGITYAHGFAFGIGLQAIEASVGVGLGLVFLAREGLTLGLLQRIPEDAPVVEEVPPVGERARVPV